MESPCECGIEPPGSINRGVIYKKPGRRALSSVMDDMRHLSLDCSRTLRMTESVRHISLQGIYFATECRENVRHVVLDILENAAFSSEQMQGHKSERRHTM